MVVCITNTGIWERRAQTLRLASNPTYSLTVDVISKGKHLQTPYCSILLRGLYTCALRAHMTLARASLYIDRPTNIFAPLPINLAVPKRTRSPLCRNYTSDLRSGHCVFATRLGEVCVLWYIDRSSSRLMSPCMKSPLLGDTVAGCGLEYRQPHAHSAEGLRRS